MSQVAVMGAGAWGTTFAAVLADAGNDVVLWARSPGLAETITGQHANPGYTQGLVLPDRVTASADASGVLSGAEAAFLALPAQHLGPWLSRWRPYLGVDVVLVSLAKGVEVGTGRRMSEVIAATTDVPTRRIAVFTGPNLAPEIAARQPTAAVIACSDHEVAWRLQGMCRTGYLRSYTHTDVVGAEIAGASKNVIALAVGMADGLGYGANTQAALATRGLAEIARLGTALGAQEATFAGLAGMGDLMATCLSPLSRNRCLGVHLGAGRSVEQARRIVGATAEGLTSATALLGLARAHAVEVPLIEQVERVVHTGRLARDVVDTLMRRDARPERDRPRGPHLA
ncbi:MAG: NAD(P)H-dependent glycerol-3-phosphate dehydrogenase [Actinomycetes bacterium]